MAFVNLDTVQRPTDGDTLDPTWGDQVNDNFNALYTLLQSVISSGGPPIGAVISYGGGLVSPSANWLVCDGSKVSRSTYSGLFNVFGTQWGAGDGSTTFGLPDLRSRTILGAGSSTSAGLTVRALGTSGGTETHILAPAELAAHAHTVTDSGHAHGINDPSHHHSFSGPNNNANILNQVATTNGVTGTNVTYGVTVNPPSAFTIGNAATGVSVVPSGTGVRINNTGSGTAFSLVNPYAALTYLVRAL